MKTFLRELSVGADPLTLYRDWAAAPRSILLESARPSPKLGSHSLVLKDPFMSFEAKGRRVRVETHGRVETLEADPFAVLEALLRKVRSRSEARPGFLTGAAAGYFGYEAKNLLERLPQTAVDDLGLPDILLYFYRDGIAVDHERNKASLFVNDTSAARAKHRLAALEDSVHASRSRGGSHAAVPPGRMGRTGLSVVRPSLGRRAFCRAVNRAKAAIRAGDIYQANLSRRFSLPVHEPSLAIYEKLRRLNPSPFFGFMDTGAFEILSGSPERLVQLNGRSLETRPIAGTRPRGVNARKDSALSAELLLDPKERAEHVMLVDLERNDAGRVSEYGSVAVDELMTLEDYSHVKHIVSNVRGTLRAGLSALDAFRAFFPGGTITGTPKIRSMEWIDALEPVARGPYTGSLGYFAFNGDMDWNILIRSLVIKDGTAHLQTGAGIVADSEPNREYEETLHKAKALFAALGVDSARGRSRTAVRTR